MLTGKQRHFLRGLGHHLDPTVQVGKEGISSGLVGALDVALEQHELIKVRLGDSVGAARREIAAAIAEAAGAELAGVVGRTLLLYRARKEEPEIVLP